jgi:hypothetical protein
MSCQNDRKLVARPVTDWLVLPVVLAVGWSSTLVAAPLVTAGSLATGADTAPPGKDATDAAPPATDAAPPAARATDAALPVTATAGAAPPTKGAANPTPSAVRAPDTTPSAMGSHPITSWVALGFGTAGIGGQDGDGVRLELAVAAGIHLFSLRYVYAEDTNGSCGGFICLGNDVSLPHNSVSEIALQYGVKKRGPYVLGTASAGVAALWTMQRGDTLQSSICFFGCVDQYNSINARAVGATAEIGGYLTSRYVSVGPTFVVDVNSLQSFWSLLFDLHFGWMGDGGVFRGRQSP